MNNDLISREALKEQFNGVPNSKDKDIALMLIDNATTVPLPDFKEGYKQAIIDGKTNYSTNYSNETSKWIKMSDRYGIYFACYKCGYDRERATTNFCPNCGAEMRGEDK